MRWFSPNGSNNRPAHLLKYNYQDPHWSRRRGLVMAWQQVSMFGLVLVEKRAVPYAAVDPVEARRVFILEALVRGELDTRRGFQEHNRVLREEIELLEQKRRSRDVLVDEAVLFDFFDARLPATVNSAAAMEKWLEQIGPSGRRQMLLSHEVLTREGAGTAPADAYPDNWRQGSLSFPLAYHFAPGAADDGVSMKVPMELLNTLDEGRMQWLVPAMLRDKVIEIIRNLPKPVRRALTPAPQFADAAIERLSGQSANRHCTRRWPPASISSAVSMYHLNCLQKSRYPHI